MRISEMEKIFDEVNNILKNSPDKLQTPNVLDKINKLSNYYSNGDWMYDYDLDDKKMLPHELKRGVLSQDGLYDLLCEVNSLQNNKNG